MKAFLGKRVTDEKSLEERLATLWAWEAVQVIPGQSE
jgi:hypothetical protein